MQGFDYFYSDEIDLSESSGERNFAASFDSIEPQKHIWLQCTTLHDDVYNTAFHCAKHKNKQTYFHVKRIKNTKIEIRIVCVTKIITWKVPQYQ